jgi:SfnB family sulfur acquisition oxidoreductase
MSNSNAVVSLVTSNVTNESEDHPSFLQTSIFQEGSSRIHRIASEGEAVECARALAAEIKSEGADRDHEGEPPLRELERASETGLTAIFVPKEYGGLGASVLTLTEVIKALGTTHPSVAQILIAQYSLGDVVTTHGTASQKQFFLSRILAGARIGNALTEGKTKSAADTRTRLLADGNDFILVGEKFYTTGSYLSHWFPVLALDEADSIVFAFVRRDAPGLTVRNDWKGVGQRSSLSGTALFDRVPVSREAVIRPSGAPLPHSGNTFAQVLHAAVDAGIGAGALEEAIDFLNNQARAWPEARVDRAAQEPHVIRIFGELKVHQLAGEALVREAAARLDALRHAPTDPDLQTATILAVSAARAQTDAAVLSITSEIFALGGARTSYERWNLDRFWRNARTHTVHDPVRWHHHHIGDYWLNGVRPADNARAAVAKDKNGGGARS